MSVKTPPRAVGARGCFLYATLTLFIRDERDTHRSEASLLAYTVVRSYIYIV